MLKVGSILYHKTGDTTCTVLEIDDKNLKVKLDKLLSNKEYLTLPITHIGYYLFYDKKDSDLDISVLANIPMYANYGKKIKEYINKYKREEDSRKLEEERLKKEVFEKRQITLNQRKIDSETQQLLREQKREYINNVISRREIENLIHFTQLGNLKSILENGLVPVSTQERRKIISIHNDNNRLDHQLNSTSISMTFPNYKLFYNFRENVFPNAVWVILIIDKNLLLSDEHGIKYYKGNAAKKDIRYYTENANLESLFEQEYQIDGHKIYRDNLGIPVNFTTNPQAEILVSGIIGVKYIKEIFFNKKDEMDKFIFNNQALLNTLKIKISLNDEYFKYRCDFNFWKGIS